MLTVAFGLTEVITIRAFKIGVSAKPSDTSTLLFVYVITLKPYQRKEILFDCSSFTMSSTGMSKFLAASKSSL